MAVFAVGDIQGCLGDLRQALDQAGFNPHEDHLWCVGDLINRGPHSLETLHFIRGLEDRAICVLGNHDITLLALAAGVPVRTNHQLHEVLESPDLGSIVDWLRHRPILHHDPTINTAMVHAGILPSWDLKQAVSYAEELQHFLRHKSWACHIDKLYGARPRRWKRSRKGFKRLRLLCNIFTRMRYLDHKGRLDLSCKQSPTQHSEDMTPWFEVPDRKTQDTRIVFGHWATLGLHTDNNVLGLDTGCVWGGQLTIARLDTPTPPLTQVSCAHHARAH